MSNVQVCRTFASTQIQFTNINNDGTTGEIPVSIYTYVMYHRILNVLFPYDFAFVLFLPKFYVHTCIPCYCIFSYK